MLQSVGSKRVRHDLATEQQQQGLGVGVLGAGTRGVVGSLKGFAAH